MPSNFNVIYHYYDLYCNNRHLIFKIKKMICLDFADVQLIVQNQRIYKIFFSGNKTLNHSFPL